MRSNKNEPTSLPMRIDRNLLVSIRRLGLVWSLSKE
jgi:hypothetical protein